MRTGLKYRRIRVHDYNDYDKTSSATTIYFTPHALSTTREILKTAAPATQLFTVLSVLNSCEQCFYWRVNSKSYLDTKPNINDKTYILLSTVPSYFQLRAIFALIQVKTHSYNSQFNFISGKTLMSHSALLL
jgi:hypothetical protein